LARPAALDVELEIDVGNDRIVESIAGRGEHLEDGRAGLRVLAAQNAQERCALSGRCAAVNDMDAFAFAFMDRPGPAKDAARTESVEPRRAVITLLDVEHGKAMAMAMGRQRVELAGAAIVAIAVTELLALDFPWRHDWPRTQRLATE